jgi:subtilisin family serine protease
MSLTSPSHRKVPKSLALFALLGLLLIAAVAFVPNSNAGLPAFQNGGSSGSKRSRPEFVPGEVLVRFKSDRAFEGSAYMPVPNEVAQQKIDGIQGSATQEEILVQVDRFGGSDLVDGLRIAHAADTGKAIAALRARDDVEYAEPNYIVHAFTPNDPCFPTNSLAICQSTSLYGMNNIAAPQAWNTTTGSPNIVVGVIDEGIDISHPDLQPNIWANPVPGGGSITESNGNHIIGDVHGYDFINNSGTIPAESHATHVAGTIGAVGNNGVGVVGVNWQVKLMSLRFIDQATNNGSTGDAIRAYNYAKQMRDLFVSSNGASGANIRALNASYGGGGFSKAEQDALTALGNSGILFVAAAGNDGRNTDAAPNYPSGYNLTNMISVAATTQPDTLAGFSNFGAKSVLMGAPGVGILSTTPADTYSVFSGTSMATPHVAGAAALVCAANPNVSVNQLHALLAFNGDVIPALQGNVTLTGRRLNVFKSIQALNEGDTTPPGTAANFRVTSQTGRAINLAWTASGDDGPTGQASLYDISFTDQFTGAVIPLTTIAPAPSGSPQAVTVNIPYRHTSGFLKLREFDNVGNEGTATTFPVTVDRLIADPYATSLSSPAALSTGGTPLLLSFDDRYLENYALPTGFIFPFFGQTFTAVTISTNGNLYFSTPRKRSNGDADDVPSSIGDLSTFKMIAGMWDDLDLRTSRRADADVYFVQPDSSRVIFRWQGVQFGDGVNGAPINFEIELNTNGTIKTRYGADNTNLLPVVGISGGEPDVYVADALTSELSPISLTNAQGAVFTPRALVPQPTIQFSLANYPVNEGDGHVNIALTRSGDTTSSAAVNYATNDSAGLTNCNV